MNRNALRLKYIKVTNQRGDQMSHVEVGVPGVITSESLGAPVKGVKPGNMKAHAWVKCEFEDCKAKRAAYYMRKKAMPSFVRRLDKLAVVITPEGEVDTTEGTP
jgi:hypothetical protein